MSDRKKYPRDYALAVALAIKEALAPSCVLIEIAGSIRRLKPMVGDVEICFVPRLVTEPDGLFDFKSVSLPDKLIDTWLATGMIAKRMTDGAAPPKLSSWGPSNKHAVHLPSGIPVDFFCEMDSKDWPRTLVVRTGPRDFNVHLMATAPRHGVQAHAYGEALHDMRTGERIIVATEREFIERCGVKWAEPENRR